MAACNTVAKAGDQAPKQTGHVVESALVVGWCVLLLLLLLLLAFP